MRPSETARTALAIFAVLFTCYAWFHQGGGWNQNVRFDQIRAIVEGGDVHIDDYLLYQIETDAHGVTDYRRLSLSDPAMRSPRLPRANTLDLSRYDGHYYPNKPPGISFLAAPAYLFVLGGHRLSGEEFNPDRWRALTMNAHLVTALSVGLIGSLGGAILFLLATRIFPTSPRAARVSAALVFGLGTLMFPFSTMLSDHGPVAAFSLAAWLCIWEAGGSPSPARRIAWHLGAGAVCGAMVCINYAAVLTGACLGLYAAWRCRSPRGSAAFVIGAAPFIAALGAYHAAAFGNPFSIAHEYMFEIFKTQAAWLGAFNPPDWSVIPELLFYRYRGLFFTSPVLLFSLWGLTAMWRSARRPEALLVASVASLFLLLNASFNGWHGGGTIGPRYLIPAIPFLCVALVPAFAGARAWAVPVIVASVFTMGVVTSVSPQVDAVIRDPLGDFYLPLARGGSLEMGGYRLRGPVSVYPVGMAGVGIEALAPGGRFARWNSYNLGESLAPNSWWSVLPPAVGVAVVWLALCRRPREARRRLRTPAAY